MLLSDDNKLILCDTRELLHTNKSSYKDIALWSQLYNLLPNGVVFLDRTKKINLPYKFHVAENMDIPTDNLQEFKKSYEDICNERALELFNYSKKLNAPIYILYSGGIDSTLILVSFFKTIPLQDLKNNITITLNNNSIAENPNFYKKYIKNTFNTYSSENFSNLFNKDCIILGGEHNDQLFGSDIIAKIKHIVDFKECLKPHTEEFIVKFFCHSGMELYAAKWWYNMLKWHSEQSGFNIDTNYKFLWWLNFCFKWQTVFFRIILRIANNTRDKISNDFISNRFFHFYSTKTFQKWAIKNDGYKILDSWNTYKYEAKKLIYEYDGNKDYFDNKLKIGSLYKIFLYRNVAWGLTEKYNYIDKYSNTEMFDSIYNKNNSFIMD